MACPPQVRSEPFVTGTKGLPNTPGGRADDAVPLFEGPRARSLRLRDRGRSGFGGAQLGARVQRHDPSRRADLHGWCAVHRQLRLLRRIERLPRSGRPLLGHRHVDRHQRLHQRVAADRHRRRHRRQQARHPRLQLVADHAVQGRDGRRHVRLQRPRPGQGRSGRRRQRQPVDPVLGRADRGRTAAARPPATRSSATATPSCAAASPSSARSRARASATTATAGATPSTRSRPASPATPGRPSSTRAATRSASSAPSPSRRWPAATASATWPRSSPTPTAPAASASRWRRAPRPSRARCSRSRNLPRSSGREHHGTRGGRQRPPRRRCSRGGAGGVKPREGGGGGSGRASWSSGARLGCSRVFRNTLETPGSTSVLPLRRGRPTFDRAARRDVL